MTSTAGHISKERLRRLHRVMTEYVERGDVPGIVTLVWSRGDIHVDAIGTPTLGHAQRIKRDAIFRVASMTKPITAAATMILVEECRLGLDDPVENWLPELANRRVLRHLDGPVEDTVPAKRSITVRDLLTYRMGFGHIWAPADAFPVLKRAEQIGFGTNVTAQPGPDEWIRRLGELPLMHQPGEKWMYAFGSEVLGVLIARVSGQTFETFLQERLFEPLSMPDTGFSVPPEKIHRLTTSYWTGFDWGATDFRLDWCKPPAEPLTVFDSAEGGRWSRPPEFPSGAGGLVSTVDDYLAFGRMMLDLGRYGGKRVLSRPTVQTMTSDHLTTEQKRASGYFEDFFGNRGWGFGLSVDTRRDQPYQSVGRFGWDGGLGTSWYSDPAEQLIGILMTQRAWTAPSPPAICRDFWASVYQAIDD
jgi:CubicO group peptidase (beta-lactamase class C family)